MNQVAFITGAAHGIGRSLALRLAQDGYAIAGIDLDATPLDDLARELADRKSTCAVRVADVTNSADLQRQVLDLEAQLGPIQLLVANAGIGVETPGLAFRAEDFKRIIDVNLVGVANSVAAVLPGMIERRGGHLVALSSVASFHGLPRLTGYSASKAGVNALMEGLRAELRQLGINVTTICPGWIRTQMTRAIHDQLPDILELDAAVEQILRAIRKKSLFHAFPTRTVWQIRILNLLPRSWQDAVLARMARQLKPRPSTPQQ